MIVATSSSADPAQRLAQLEELLASAFAQIQLLTAENKLLRQKLQALIRRYFGHAKNETLASSQLLMLLGGLTAHPATPPPPPPPPPSAPASPRTSARRPARSGLPADLPVERVVLIP